MHVVKLRRTHLKMYATKTKGFYSRRRPPRRSKLRALPRSSLLVLMAGCLLISVAGNFMTGRSVFAANHTDQIETKQSYGLKGGSGSGRSLHAVVVCSRGRGIDCLPQGQNGLPPSPNSLVTCPSGKSWCRVWLWYLVSGIRPSRRFRPGHNNTNLCLYCKAVRHIY